MNNIDFESMNKALKTGELKKELARSEVKSGMIWSIEELARASKETNCNTIVRKDIEIEKALLLNNEYQELTEKVKNLCDNHNECDKEYLLEIVNKKYLLYRKIVSEFN